MEAKERRQERYQQSSAGCESNEPGLLASTAMQGIGQEYLKDSVQKKPSCCECADHHSRGTQPLQQKRQHRVLIHERHGKQKEGDIHHERGQVPTNQARRYRTLIRCRFRLLLYGW